MGMGQRRLSVIVVDAEESRPEKLVIPREFPGYGEAAPFRRENKSRAREACA